MKPLIGISTQGREIETSLGKHQSGETITRDYVDAILDAGGIPVLLPRQSPDHVESTLAAIDGLLLSGGGDVGPENYNGHPELAEWVDPTRDVWEIALAREAERTSLPLLAICRGLQVVNVAFGGTLIEDIPSMAPSDEIHRITDERARQGHQNVHFAEGCRIANALGPDTIANSLHHQSVRDLAAGYEAVGWASDGIVKAFETTDPGWDMMAVQWHPEYLPQSQGPLFEALVEAARKPLARS